MRKTLLQLGYFLAVTPLILANSIQAAPVPSSQWENYYRIGAATYDVALWSIYEVALYAPTPVYDGTPPFALDIQYRRAFSGRAIADRSIQLIREQGFADEIRLAAWHGMMVAILPDVEVGTSLTGLFTEEGTVQFYRDGDPIGAIRDPEFGRSFFDIWLGEKAKSVKVRRQLTGQVNESDNATP